MPSFKMNAPAALLVRHCMADRGEWIEEIWAVGPILQLSWPIINKSGI